MDLRQIAIALLLKKCANKVKRVDFELSRLSDGCVQRLKGGKSHLKSRIRSLNIAAKWHNHSKRWMTASSGHQSVYKLLTASLPVCVCAVCVNATMLFSGFYMISRYFLKWTELMINGENNHAACSDWILKLNTVSVWTMSATSEATAVWALRNVWAFVFSVATH